MPYSPTRIVDYERWYGIKTIKPIEHYGSLKYVLMEGVHLEQQKDLALRVQIRNEQEASLVEQYKMRIAELKAELSLDYNDFAESFIKRLKA